MSTIAPISKEKPWYAYQIEPAYSNYVHTDMAVPADTPLTAPLAGKLTAIGYYDWGGQVTWQVDQPSAIGGHRYAYMIHMDAIDPSLRVGQQINQGQFLGYSGGENSLSDPRLKPLPTGYTHHTNTPAHSTGPHLDIGVADSPQASLDVSKQWSDALVTIARQGNIPSGAPPSPQFSLQTNCSDQCGPCDWHSPWNWPCCAGCEVANGAGTSTGGATDWSQWGNIAARGGFMVLGGILILLGAYIAVRSLGESTGVTVKLQETTKRVGAAIATEGLSEASRAGQKRATPKTKEQPAEKAA